MAFEILKIASELVTKGYPEARREMSQTKKTAESLVDTLKKLDGDTSTFKAFRAALKAVREDIQKTRAEARDDIEISVILKGAREVRAAFRELIKQAHDVNNTKAEMTVTADTSDAETKGREIKRFWGQLGKEKAELRATANTRPAENALDRLKRQKDALDEDVFIRVTEQGADEVAEKGNKIQRVMQKLNGNTTEVEVEGQGMVQTEGALKLIQAAVNKLDRSTVVIFVAVAGATAATATLIALGESVNLLSRTIQVLAPLIMPLGMALGTALGGAVTSLSVGVVALTGAIGSGLVGAMVAAAGASGPLIAAIAGIAAPVSILFSHLKEAQTATDGMAAAQDAAKSSADAYKNSQDATKNAIANIGKVEEQVARSIKSARAGVTDAREAADETAISGAQAVQSQEEALDQSRETHDEAVQTLIASEQELADLRRGDEARSMGQMEDDLTRARWAQNDALKAYNEAVKEHGARSRAAREAQLDLNDAERAYAEQLEATREQRRGGSEELQAQMKTVQENRKAESEAAKDVTDQEILLRQTRKDSADANDKAAEQILLQEQALKQAKKDGREQIKASKEAAVKAAEAEKLALEAVKSAQEEVNKATGNLTKAEQKLFDRFNRFKKEAGPMMQPAVDKAALLGVKILNLTNRYLPEFANMSSEAMSALTNVFGTFRSELKNSDFDQALEDIFDAVPKLINKLGGAAAKAVPAVVGLFAKALPYGMKLVDNIAKLIDHVVKWLNTIEGSNAVDTFFANAWHRAEQLGRAVWNLVQGFGDLFRAASEGGTADKMMGGLVELTDQFSHLFDKGTKASKMTEDFGQAAGPIFKDVGGILKEVAKQFFRVAHAGISFNSEGKKFSTLREILHAVRDSVKPIADAMIRTFKEIGPELPGLIKNIAGLFEVFGSNNPVVKTFLGILNDLLTRFNNLPDGVKATVASIASLGAIASAVTGSGGGLGALVSGLGAVWTYFKFKDLAARTDTVGNAVKALGNKSSTAAKGLDEVADHADDVGGQMTLFGGKTDDAAKKAGKSGGIFKRMGGSIKGAGVALATFLTVGTGGTILLVVAAIAAIAGAAYILYKNWDRIKEAVKPATDGFKAFWAVVGPVAKQLRGTVVKSLKTLAEGFLSTITPGKNLKEQVHNLMDSLGDLARKAAPVVIRVLKAIREWMENNQPAIRKVGQVIGWLVTAQFRMLIGGVKLVIAIVKAVIRAYRWWKDGSTELGKNIGQFLHKVEAGWERLKRKVWAVIAGILKGFSDWIRNLLDTWRGFKNDLSKAWNKLFDDLGRAWNKFKSSVGKAWNRWFGDLQRRWQQFKKDVKDAFGEFFSDLQKIWQGFKSDIQRAWDKFFRALQKIWQIFKGNIKDAFGGFFSDLVKIWTKWRKGQYKSWGQLFDDLQKTWQTFKGDIKDAWLKFWNDLKELWNDFKDALAKAWDKWFGALINRWQEFKGDLKDAWDEFWTGVADRFDSFVSNFKKARDAMFKAAKTGFTDFGDEVKKILKNRFEDAVNLVRTPLGAIAGAVAAVLKAFGQKDLGEDVGKVAAKLKQPIHFAQGGTMMQPSVGGVSDGKQPYAVYGEGDGSGPKKESYLVHGKRSNLPFAQMWAQSVGMEVVPKNARGAGEESHRHLGMEVARRFAAGGQWWPNVASVNAEVEKRWPQTHGSTYANHGTRGEASAVDWIQGRWGIPAKGEDLKRGNEIVSFLEANWGKVPIDYVIWQNQQAWKPGGFKPYKYAQSYHVQGDPDSEKHLDHVHMTALKSAPAVQGFEKGDGTFSGGSGDTYSLADRIWEGKGDPPKSTFGKIVQGAGNALLDALPGSGLIKWAASKWKGLEPLLPDELPMPGLMSGAFGDGLRAFVGENYKSWIKEWIYDKFGDIGGGGGSGGGGDTSANSPKGLTISEAVTEGGWGSRHDSAVGLAWEESGGNAGNNINQYKGLFAMGPDAFKIAGMDYSKWNDPIYNSTAAARLQAKQGWGPWSAWPVSSSSMHRGNEKVYGYEGGGLPADGVGGKELKLNIPQITRDAFHRVADTLRSLAGGGGGAGGGAGGNVERGAGQVTNGFTAIAGEAGRESIIPLTGTRLTAGGKEAMREALKKWVPGFRRGGVHRNQFNLVGNDGILSFKGESGAVHAALSAGRMWKRSGVDLRRGGPGPDVRAGYANIGTAGVTSSNYRMQVQSRFRHSGLRRAIWGHEIGHALGLDHDNSALMGTTLSRGEGNAKPTPAHIRFVRTHLAKKDVEDKQHAYKDLYRALNARGDRKLKQWLKKHDSVSDKQKKSLLDRFGKHGNGNQGHHPNHGGGGGGNNGGGKPGGGGGGGGGGGKDEPNRGDKEDKKNKFKLLYKWRKDPRLDPMYWLSQLSFGGSEPGGFLDEFFDDFGKTIKRILRGHGDGPGHGSGGDGGSGGGGGGLAQKLSPRGRKRLRRYLANHKGKLPKSIRERLLDRYGPEDHGGGGGGGGGGDHGGGGGGGGDVGGGNLAKKLSPRGKKRLNRYLQNHPGKVPKAMRQRLLERYGPQEEAESGRYLGRTDEHSSGGPKFGSTNNKLWSSETFGRVLEILKNFKVSADTYVNHPPSPKISADIWAFAGRGHAIPMNLNNKVASFVKKRLRRGLSYQLKQGDAGHSGGQRHVHNTWRGKDSSVPNVAPRPIRPGPIRGGRRHVMVGPEGPGHYHTDQPVPKISELSSTKLDEFLRRGYKVDMTDPHGRLKLPEFEKGGIVPGPLGKAINAVVHAGERVLTQEQNDAFEKLMGSIDSFTHTTIDAALGSGGGANVDSGLFSESIMERNQKILQHGRGNTTSASGDIHIHQDFSGWQNGTELTPEEIRDLARDGAWEGVRKANGDANRRSRHNRIGSASGFDLG